MGHGKFVSVDARHQVAVELSAAALDRLGISSEDRQTVCQPGSEPGLLRIRLGAAGARYVGDVCALGPDAAAWPRELSNDAVGLIINAIPLAAQWVRYQQQRGVRCDIAIYSGDLARAAGDDPVDVTSKFKATARNSREAAPAL